MDVVDQRFIQRLGGRCARFPVSCLIKDLLIDLGIESVGIVFDTTYGEGRFYGAWRPEVLIGADVRVLDWVVRPDLFIKLPVWSSWRVLKKLGLESRIDLVVVDPPWGVATGSRHGTRPHYYKPLGSPDLILEEGIKAADRLGCKYVLVHYYKVVNGDGWEIAAAKKFIYFTRYLKQNTKYNPNTSYFYILQRGD